MRTAMLAIMTETTHTLARISAPEPAERRDSPGALAVLVANLLGIARTFLDVNLIPNPPETYRQAWTQMEYIYLKHLRAHIRRVEHGVRCLILCLASELLKTKDGQAKAAALWQRPDREPPRKRPYDPLILVQEERDPKPGSFSAIAGYSRPARAKSRRLRPFEPLDWAEVSAVREINRLSVLTRAIGRVDAHALRLASRLLAGEFYTSSDEADGPGITGFDSFVPTQADHLYRCERPHFPAFFRRLETWYPPDELFDQASEDARSDLTDLHLAGCGALSACPQLTAH